MRTNQTFSISYFVRRNKKHPDLSLLYARLTVNGKPLEVSLKRALPFKDWDSSAGKVKGTSLKAKEINMKIDRTRTLIYKAYDSLLMEDKFITSQLLKARFLGTDQLHKSLCDLLTYHNTKMVNVLTLGTLKNYFTTERYIKRYLKNKLRTNDIYLKQITYKFILDFEQFLRNGKSINQSQPLNNNGVMKHLERLKKMMGLALRLEWIEKDPFLRFSLKFTKPQRAFLSQSELEVLEFCG
ncbi:phage integrase SAM-like domain and Arm DNA-binding domain-containing protein [Gillisia limnaea]|uniref:Transposase n=1 Tax=Gillisia limnaea (strain DSM 15749 / LMG 21470 / R-8282) TaxID=865937 RepID=H2BR09_GILLR|nr:phage integrase SAM-like domain and Arm DNA-binding domain-containing protein [Gillisia limnaea]EHQ04328.1 transposase [Gillisia limnaea DSM 15749]